MHARVKPAHDNGGTMRRRSFLKLACAASLPSGWLESNGSGFSTEHGGDRGIRACPGGRWPAFARNLDGTLEEPKSANAVYRVSKWNRGVSGHGCRQP